MSIGQDCFTTDKRLNLINCRALKKTRLYRWARCPIVDYFPMQELSSTDKIHDNKRCQTFEYIRALQKYGETKLGSASFRHKSAFFLS